MDVSQLNLPPLEVILKNERDAWTLAEKAGKTFWSWAENESYIRRRYAELMSMSEEQRDVAVTEGHIQKTGELQAILKHIDEVLLPAAREREASLSRSMRRAKAKFNRKQDVKKRQGAKKRRR